MKGIRGHLMTEMGTSRTASMHQEGPTVGVPAFNPARDLDSIPVRVRPAEEQDAAMIYDSWLNSYASQNKDQPPWAVYPLQKTVIRRLLKVAVTLIAAGNTPESQNDIYSWMCAERSPNGLLIIHFAFTKMIFRRRGLAEALLNGFDHKPGDRVFCSHKTWLLKDLRGKYNVQYVPHLLFDWGTDQLDRAYRKETHKPDRRPYDKGKEPRPYPFKGGHVKHKPKTGV